MYSFSCEPPISRNMGCGDRNMYHCSPTIVISQIYIVQFFPRSPPTGLNTIHKVICYIMLKSLLGNEMSTTAEYMCSHKIFLISNNLLETISNHFSLFVINKDDNQRLFQSCIVLVPGGYSLIWAI